MNVINIKQMMSLASVQIQILDKFEGCLATASAFFYQHLEAIYLVTNWHNVAGKNPNTGAYLWDCLRIPFKLSVPFYKEMQYGANKHIVRSLIHVNLYENGDPIWYVYPELNQKVDVAVIPLELGSSVETDDPDYHHCLFIPVNSPHLHNTSVPLEAGMDAFVVGYPRGISTEGLPIWKRGTIANEIDIDINGLPMLYVDTATREGMSGSPVFAQASGLWLPEGKTEPMDRVIGVGRRFIGVYSGRVGEDTFLAQLGVVWKESALIKIIESKNKDKECVCEQ